MNGGRVGDPATWAEEGNVEPEYRLGTINIILCISADLSEGAMARALMTCTEAKTAALQELLAESHYSRGLATGSGTDGAVIIADMESDKYLTEAGKHCKLGELIGKAVKAAVKETLYLQTRLGPERQHNVFRRMSRFGVKEADLYHRCRKEMPQQAPSRPIFSEIAEKLAKDGTMVARTSFLAHGIDQMDWGLLSVTETLQVSDEILKSMGGKGISGMEELHTPDEAVHCIVDAFEKMMIEQILKEYQKETREE